MLSINTTTLALLDSPDLLIGHFDMEMEEVLEAKTQYLAWLNALEIEWPAERVKEWILQYKRDQYTKSVRYINELERKNRDARAGGMSFKDREEKFGKKIRVGHTVLKDYEQEGRALKTKQFLASDFIQPLDMPTIQKEGFEKHLKWAVF